MGTLVAVHLELLERLQAVMHAEHGPAEKLPTVGGRIQQCAVVWPSTGTIRGRFCGGTADRLDTIRVVFVGATAIDALVAADKGRTALAGARLTASGPGSGMVTEAGFQSTEPIAEPGTDPVRVSLPIQFDVYTKEP